MKVTINQTISNNEFQITLKNNDENKITIKLFTGGHMTVDAGLMELPKKYIVYRQINPSEEILLEEGGVELFDFKNWFWLDIKNDQGGLEKYFFNMPTENGKVLLSRREKDMPIKENGYIIEAIIPGQTREGKNSLQVSFTTHKNYEFEVLKDGGFSVGEELKIILEGEKTATSKAVNDIASWVVDVCWPQGINTN